MTMVTPNVKCELSSTFQMDHWKLRGEDLNSPNQSKCIWQWVWSKWASRAFVSRSAVLDLSVRFDQASKQHTDKVVYYVFWFSVPRQSKITIYQLCRVHPSSDAKLERFRNEDPLPLNKHSRTDMQEEHRKHPPARVACALILVSCVVFSSRSVGVWFPLLTLQSPNVFTIFIRFLYNFIPSFPRAFLIHCRRGD